MSGLSNSGSVKMQSSDRDMDTQPIHADAPFLPSVADLLVVKAMLRKTANLPVEIVNAVIDAAEYWPHTSTEFDAAALDTRPGVLRVAGGRANRENKFLLRTPPLGILKAARGPAEATTPLDLDPPRPLEGEFAPEDFVGASGVPAEVGMLAHPCRKIVWYFESSDQGWSGEPAEYKGTYQHSHTWFEAGLERCNKKRQPELGGATSRGQEDTTGTPQQQRPSFDPTRPGDVVMVQPEVTYDEGPRVARHALYSPDSLLVQSNVHGKPDFTKHTVTWSWKGDITDPQSERADRELRLKGRGTATGDGAFVRALKVGDMVTLWAKARFGGWSNRIKKARVDVYWAI